MIKRILLCVLFALFASASYGQEMWNDIKLPADLKTTITAFASEGADLYLGTSSQGVYFSNDSGQTWQNNSSKAMIAVQINFLLISPNDYVFAVGPTSVFRSPIMNNQWTALTNYLWQTGTIQCADVSSLGSVALGTNQGVNVSSTKNNGDSWTQVTNQLGPIDVRSLIINKNEQIFYSCIYKKLPTIFLSNINGASFKEIKKNITESPMVTGFAMDPNGVIFAAVGTSIYQYDDATSLWSLLTSTGGIVIDRLKAAGTNYLIVISDVLLKIFDRSKKAWTQDNSGFNFNGKIIDVTIDAGQRITVITQNSLAKTLTDLDGTISIGTDKYFTVYDSRGLVMANRTFALYKATCDNNQDFKQNVKTNNLGVFPLNYFTASLHVGDQIKLEQLVQTELAIKTGHEEFGNKIRDIYLNNMKYDTVGNTSYYSLTKVDNQAITMDHGLIRCFIIVSVEWDAKPEYLANVKKALVQMSAYLYDVTDGQLYVEGIGLYDNKQKWDQADIQIFANNMLWPNAIVNGIHSPDIAQANIRMPRIFVGNSDPNRNLSNINDWYLFNDSLWSIPLATTMAHELGHYMFNFKDEYVWTNEAKKSLYPAGSNFGFMQYNYLTAIDWSSEMSTPAKYTNPDFRYTAQWTYRGSDCWTQFKTANQGVYRSPVDNNLTYLPILMPSERTLHAGRDFLIGPNDFNYRRQYPTRPQLSCKISPLVTINVFDQNSGTGDFRLTIVDNHSRAIANADVTIGGTKALPRMIAGKSADNGNMIVPGAYIGDHFFVTYNKGSSDRPSYFFYEGQVTLIHGTKSSNDIPLADEEVQLKEMSGNYRIIPSIKYDGNGNYNLNLFTNKSFNVAPLISLMSDGKTEKQYVMNYETKGSIYNANLFSSLNDGFILFNAVDSLDKPFPVIFNYEVSNFGNNIFAPNGSAELLLDSNNKSIKEIASFTSTFAPLMNGIPSNAKQGGVVVSFSAAPTNFAPKTTNFVNIRYLRDYLTTKEEESLSIHKWDETNLKWTLLASSIDTAHQIVTAPISSDGTYAAFATYITAGVGENQENNNYFGLDVYPNPVTSDSKIEFFLAESTQVNLSLYNSLGQEVISIASTYMDYGKQSYTLNMSNLENGVYYIKLTVGDKLSTKKVVLIK